MYANKPMSGDKGWGERENVFFARSSTARKIFSGLREKLFDHDDSTGPCDSETLTAMKKRIPFGLWSSARIFTP